jgi:hypothetical protein
MRKIALVAAMFVILAVFSSAPVLAEGNAPVISSLEIISGAEVRVNTQPDLVIRFTSDQKPEDVVLSFYMLYNQRVFKTIYSSKKEEVRTEVVEKGEGLYEVTAFRKVNTPPGPAKSELKIWVESGGKRSNQIEVERRIVN